MFVLGWGQILITINFCKFLQLSDKEAAVYMNYPEFHVNQVLVKDEIHILTFHKHVKF